MACEKPVGVVTGMVQETTVFDGLSNPPRVLCHGIGPKRARSAAEALVAKGVAGLVSLGTAGGLSPDLAAGTVNLATRVLTPEGEVFETDTAWRSTLQSSLNGTVSIATGPQVGSAEPIRDETAKAKLRDESGALAVDMESQAVAAVAKEAGLPFIVIRAVADDSRRPLPGWLKGVVSRDGAIHPWVLVPKILFRPDRIPELMRLGKANKRSLGALRAVVELGGDGLGLTAEPPVTS